MGRWNIGRWIDETTLVMMVRDLRRVVVAGVVVVVLCAVAPTLVDFLGWP